MDHVARTTKGVNRRIFSFKVPVEPFVFPHVYRWIVKLNPITYSHGTESLSNAVQISVNIPDALQSAIKYMCQKLELTMPLFTS